MTQPDLTDLRARTRAWFKALRDRLCGAFEQLETDYRGPESEITRDQANVVTGWRPGASCASRGSGPKAAAA